MKTKISSPSNVVLSARPIIEIIPLKAAIQSEVATEMTVLLRIVAPKLAIEEERPRLNLGFVIDRSGSMGGDKLQAAKDAVCYALERLSARDRVSITIYDDEIETVVPSTLATDKTALKRQIKAIRCGGSTDLHGGWLEGGVQTSAYLEKECLNRVLLLTDGLANCGKTDPDSICSDVHGLAKRGISTSTLGVGDDYNEDLLEAMARSGDGNYYFIEGASRMESIFAGELHGLMATLGHTVSLGIEAQAGVEIIDVLNDLERNNRGRYLLPNLIAGSATEIVLKLRVPARRGNQDLCFFRLAWTSPENAGRQVIREALSLPAVSASDWEKLPANARVSEQVAHKEAARIREKAIEEMESGNVDAARGHLQSHRSYVAAAAAAAAWLSEELSESLTLEQNLVEGDQSRALKSAKYSNYRKRRSR